MASKIFHKNAGEGHVALCPLQFEKPILPMLPKVDDPLLCIQYSQWGYKSHKAPHWSSKKQWLSLFGVCVCGRTRRAGCEIKAKWLKTERGVIALWSFFQKIPKNITSWLINPLLTPEVSYSRPIALMLVSKQIAQIMADKSHFCTNHICWALSNGRCRFFWQCSSSLNLFVWHNGYVWG